MSHFVNRTSATKRETSKTYHDTRKMSPISSHVSLIDDPGARRLRDIKDMVRKELGKSSVEPSPRDAGYRDSDPYATYGAGLQGSTPTFHRDTGMSKDRMKRVQTVTSTVTHHHGKKKAPADDGFALWVRVDNKEYRASMRGAGPDGFKLDESMQTFEVKENDRVVVYPLGCPSLGGHSSIAGAVTKSNQDDPYCSFVIQSSFGQRFPVNIAQNCKAYDEITREYANGRITLKGKKYRGLLVEHGGSPQMVLISKIPATLHSGRNDTLTITYPNSSKMTSHSPSSPEAVTIPGAPLGLLLYTLSPSLLLFLLPQTLSVQADPILNNSDAVFVREDGKDEEGKLRIGNDGSIGLVGARGKRFVLEVESEGESAPSGSTIDHLVYHVKDIVYRRKSDAGNERRGSVGSKGRESRNSERKETLFTEIKRGSSRGINHDRRESTASKNMKGSYLTAEVVPKDVEISGSFEFDLICPNGDRLRIYIRPKSETRQLETDVSAAFTPTANPPAYNHPFVLMSGSTTFTSTPLLTPRGAVYPPPSCNLLTHTIKVVHYVPNRQEEERQRLLQEENERRARAEAEERERQERIREEEERLRRVREDEEERLRRLREEEDRVRREREEDRLRREQEEEERLRRLRDEEEERLRRLREEDEERERRWREDEDRKRREDEEDEIRRNRLRQEEEDRLDRMRIEEEIVRRRLIEEEERLARIRLEEEDRLRKAREIEDLRVRKLKEDEEERERRRKVEEERLRRIQDEEERIQRAKAEEEERLRIIRIEEEKIKQIREDEEKERRRRQEEDKQRRLRDAEEDRLRKQRADEEEKVRRQKLQEEEVERRRRMREEDEERKRREREAEDERIRRIMIEEERIRRIREEEEEAFRRAQEEERERLRRLQMEEEERIRRMLEEEELDRRRRAEEDRLRRAKEAEEERLRQIHEEQERLRRERDAEENRLRMIAEEQEKLRQAEIEESNRLREIEDETYVHRVQIEERSKELQRKRSEDELRRRERDETERKLSQEREEERRRRRDLEREISITRFTEMNVPTKTVTETHITRRYEEVIDQGSKDSARSRDEDGGRRMERSVENDRRRDSGSRDDDRRKYLEDAKRKQAQDMAETQRRIKEMKENFERKKISTNNTVDQSRVSRASHESIVFKPAGVASSSVERRSDINYARRPEDATYTRSGHQDHSPLSGNHRYGTGRDTAAYTQTRSTSGQVNVHIQDPHHNQPAMIEVTMEDSQEDIDFKGYGTVKIRSKQNSPDRGERYSSKAAGPNETIVREQIRRVNISSGLGTQGRSHLGNNP